MIFFMLVILEKILRKIFDKIIHEKFRVSRDFHATFHMIFDKTP